MYNTILIFFEVDWTEPGVSVWFDRSTIFCAEDQEIVVLAILFLPIYTVFWYDD